MYLYLVLYEPTELANDTDIMLLNLFAKELRS